MDAISILSELNSLGITVTLDGDEIVCSPGSKIPSVLKPAIHEHKAEIIHLLNRESVEHLLAWASELSERDIVLTQPLTFLETPLRPINIARVSWYAANYLRSITFARNLQQSGGWPPWTATWARGRELEALWALAALRDALKERDLELEEGGFCQYEQADQD